MQSSTAQTVSGEGVADESAPTPSRRKFPAPLTCMMKDRVTALLIALVPVVLVGAGLCGISVWRCPAAEMGGSCPGCGLTRAVMLLVTGHFAESWHMHAFAPLLLLGWVLLALAAILRGNRRERLLAIVTWTEQRLGISVWVWVGLFVYWLARK